MSTGKSHEFYGAPRKLNKNVCIVCKTTSTHKDSWRLISSPAGKKKHLSDLIYKYGEVRVVDGVICRNCERKLIHIDKCIREFRDKCQKNLQYVAPKRCVSETERENSFVIQDAKKVCSKLFILPCSSKFEKNSGVGTGDGKHQGKHTSFGGYFPPTPLTPILPKQSNSGDVSTTPYPVAFVDVTVKEEEVDKLSDKSPLNSDHDYSCPTNKATLPPEKQTGKSKSTSKTNSEPAVCASTAHQLLNTLLLHSDHYENSDYLSNAEWRTIISILPLRSRRELVKSLLNFDNFSNIIEDVTVSKLSKNYDILSNRKRGRLSVLVTKDLEDLKTFEWNKVITELMSEFPLLAKIFLAFILPDSLSASAKIDRLSTLIPRIGFLYAVLAQGRNPELSRVQRIIDLLLFDNMCEQKVFDRLNPMGICLSYSHSLRIWDKFAGDCSSAVLKP